jgi:hypothetical protein
MKIERKCNNFDRVSHGYYYLRVIIELNGNKEIQINYQVEANKGRVNLYITGKKYCPQKKEWAVIETEIRVKDNPNRIHAYRAKRNEAIRLVSQAFNRMEEIS